MGGCVGGDTNKKQTASVVGQRGCGGGVVNQQCAQKLRRASAVGEVGGGGLAEAKQRLKAIQQAAIQQAQQQQQVAAAAAAAAKPLAAAQQQQQGQQGAGGAQQGQHPGPQSYEISPYKSDFESDDDQPKKPVPEWARPKALLAQLAAQVWAVGVGEGGHADRACAAPALHTGQFTRLPPPCLLLLLLLQTRVDPDAIFQQHQKTCSLDEVFAAPAGAFWGFGGGRGRVWWAGVGGRGPARSERPPLPDRNPPPPQSRQSRTLAGAPAAATGLRTA